MENVAITEWNGVVSPVYDMACRLLLLSGSGEGTIHDVSTMSIGEKSLFCEREQVGTLLCGAISAKALSMLNERGIRVISWICGPVQKIVDAYFKGVDLEKEFPMPGGIALECVGGRQWRGGECRAMP